MSVRSSFLSTLGRSLRFVVRAAPVLSISMLCTIMLSGLIPAILVLYSRDLIDAVSEQIQGSRQIDTALLRAVILWASLLFLNIVVDLFDSLLFSLLRNKLLRRINLNLIHKAGSLKDLANFENPALYDDVHIIQAQSLSRPVDLLVNFGLTLRSSIVILGMLVILAKVHYLIPLIIIVSAIPHALCIVKVRGGGGWQLTLKTVRNERLAKYFTRILLEQRLLKESIFYNLGNLARKRYEDNHNLVIRERKQLLFKETLILIPASLLSIAGSLGVLFFIVFRGGGNFASAGALVMFFQAFFQVQINLEMIVGIGGYLRVILFWFDKFFRFMHWENKIVLKDGPLPTEPPISSEPPTAPGQPASPSPIPLIEFRNVSFRYPGSPLPALRNISFRLHQGQTLALVGKNGSGKSTIIKLLLRFYDPTSGSITCLGKPIEDIALDKWRSTLSCVFQDFARFRLPLVDSVALANQDIPPDIPRITRIFQAMDFTEHIAFSEGREGKGREGKKDREGGKNQKARLQNINLGKEFDGLEPSGGQWQKIAIARALYRNADIVIMDEPTASLDPLAEARIFADFQQLATGKTSIMVTHRLGSTQSADKIIVLNEGSLAEEGTHPQLMAQPTLYAQMYATQQNQYSGGTGGTGGT